EPTRRRGGSRLRVAHVAPLEAAPAEQLAAMSPPQAAILERAAGEAQRAAARDGDRPSPAVIERLRRQDVELARLRSELDPQRRAEERRAHERTAQEVAELRAALEVRDARIERLQRARLAETSPMRMSGFALDAFNQSSDLERMGRIARTLGDPVVNVRDEGPGIPRRVRVTLCWDIAWYEFTVKLDLGAGRASVHETGTGGDPSVLAPELRRANARWSGSGLKLA
ncbi:MAG: hypothetical protein JWM98_2998, partial [Thermoleophilia bacterium]|nr:hypothetical protein [Thermoleophilia bacterium]